MLNVTVKDLIKALQKYPEDMQVVCEGDDYLHVYEQDDCISIENAENDDYGKKVL